MRALSSYVAGSSAIWTSSRKLMNIPAGQARPDPRLLHPRSVLRFTRLFYVRGAHMSGPHDRSVSTAATHPARVLSLGDAVAMIVGIVVGAGIFRAPSLVAANASGGAPVLLAWVAGGVIALAGALC